MYSTWFRKSVSFRIWCSQNRLCQTDCSFLCLRVLSRGNSSAHLRVSQLLIGRQRVEKLSSPSCRGQMQCRWSGSSTKASILKGWECMTCLIDSRNRLTLGGSVNLFIRPKVTTVKKDCCWVSFLNPTRLRFTFYLCWPVPFDSRAGGSECRKEFALWIREKYTMCDHCWNNTATPLNYFQRGAYQEAL